MCDRHRRPPPSSATVVRRRDGAAARVCAAVHVGKSTSVRSRRTWLFCRHAVWSRYCSTLVECILGSREGDRRAKTSSRLLPFRKSRSRRGCRAAAPLQQGDGGLKVLGAHAVHYDLRPTTSLRRDAAGRDDLERVEGGDVGVEDRRHGCPPPPRLPATAAVARHRRGCPPPPRLPATATRQLKVLSLAPSAAVVLDALSAPKPQ